MWCGSAWVRRNSVQGAAWLIRVQRGSVRVRRSSVQSVAWLSSGCSVDQFRVRHGSVQGAAWLS
jgi:hypothetical protein